MATFDNFDANTTPQQTEFKPLPDGQYLAVIIDSKEKPTKNAQRFGDGSFSESFIEFTFQIVEGEFQGRRVWTRLNLKNKSEQAQAIARSELSSICHAVNVMRPRDSLELHNLPLVISVKCKKRHDSDELTNVIKGYAKKETLTQKAPTANQATPPWQRAA
jgi:hypothetical protein